MYLTSNVVECIIVQDLDIHNAYFFMIGCCSWGENIEVKQVAMLVPFSIWRSGYKFVKLKN